MLYLLAKTVFKFLQPRTAAAIAAAFLALLPLANQQARALTFTDIGASLPGVDGASVAWGDYDNDGFLDLLITGSGGSYVYHNNGNGTFTLAATLTGITYGQAVWGDYNNDGRLDVMQDGIASGNETWQIYRNDGSNIFTSISFPVPPFGNMSQPSERFVSCAWGDYDNDGKLDALFAAWPYSTLYHNNGNDSFSDSGNSIPLAPEGDVAWADYNNDGYPDFVVNGGGGTGMTALFLNQGNGLIVPATNVLTGVYASSAAWEDFNNNGTLDLAVTGINNNLGYISMVLVGDGHGGFTNAPAGLDGSVTGSIAWGDFDNDGLPDLVLSSGASTGTTRVYHNNGNGTFTDTGVSLPGCGDGGVAVGDFNNDGKLDIALVGSGVTKIFRNDSAIPANSVPNPPQFFSATPTTNAMIFSWTAATDANQSGGLSYNLRVGTTPGGVDVVSPMADPATGFRRIPALGNAGAILSKPLTHLKPGTYYWSIQSIDHNFAGSQFATESSFTISAATFTTQPSSQTNAPGTSVNFQVATAGTSPIGYQWFLNGTPLSDGARVSGSATTSLSITNLQVTDAGNYTAVAMNVAGSVTSSVATLTITAPPVITTQPTNVTVAAGATTTFSVVAAGTGPFTYLWQFGGTNISVGTNATLTLTDIQLSQAGSYAVAVSNSYGGLISSNAILTVIPMSVAIQPSAQTVVGGANATFATSVSGVGPFTYQWQFAGANITNATNSSLALTNTQASQQGAYDVIVNNAYGFVVSSNAQLTVNPRATIQPPVQLTAPGSTVTFTAVEGGLDAGTTYQWQFLGTNLPGATTNPLVLINVQTTQAGAYDVIISNSFGSAVSTNAILSLAQIVAWGDNTYGQTNVPLLTNAVAIAAGYNHNLALGSDGTVAAWGDNSSGQTNVPTGLNNVMAISAGNGFSAALQSNGTVVAWGSNGSGQTNVPVGLSNVVAISCGGSGILALKNDGTVTGWGGQVSSPAGVSNIVAVSAGADFSLALRSDGTVTGWGFNGNGALNIPLNLSNVVAISGQSAGHGLALKSDGTVAAWGFNYYGEATVPSGLSNVVAISAGYYHSLALQQNGRVVAWGDSSSGKTSIPAGLTNAVSIAAGSGHSMALLDNGAPVIAQQPFSQQPYTGQNIVLYAGVAGSARLNYQWQLDGVNIDGATNAIFILSDAQAANAGSYSVTVSNAYGRVTSSSVPLTVLVSGPIILSQPTNTPSLMFSNVALSVKTTGSWPLSFQWQFNGVNIDNATNPVLAFTNLQLSSEGVYDVVVSNAYGTVISSNALLSISHVVVWGSPGYQPLGLANVMAINGYPAALTSDGHVVWWTSTSLQTVFGLSNVVAISPYVTFTGEALSVGGAVSRWNTDGALKLSGSGSTNAVAMAANGSTDLELRPNGTLAGSATNGMSPIVLAGLTNVVAVSEGAAFSMALKATGSIVVWGDNSDGQQNIPPGLTNAIAIAAGGFHCLALKTNGTVVAWGGNFDHQTNVPSGLSNVVAIAAGEYHSLALRNDGTVVSWGYNTSGQTNVPAGLSNVVMIAGGATCSVALVGTNPPVTQAMVSNPTINLNGFSLTVPTQSGRVYDLEFKRKLSDTNWTMLPTLVAGNGTNVVLTDISPTNSQRFYRVRRW